MRFLIDRLRCSPNGSPGDFMRLQRGSDSSRSGERGSRDLGGQSGAFIAAINSALEETRRPQGGASR